MESLITLVIVLVFIYLRDRHISKLNQDQFTKFIDIIKNNNNKEEEEIIPLPKEEQKDEIVELGDVDPDELLKHLHGNN